MKQSVLLLMLFVLSGAASPHQFYVSLFELHYNNETGSIQTTIRVFTDDLERALEAEGTGAIRLGTGREHANTDSYIVQYIDNRFLIVSNNDTVELHYLGKEVEIDLSYLYFESDSIAIPENVVIESHLLIDVCEGQKNMIEMTVGTQEDGLILSMETTSGFLEFN